MKDINNNITSFFTAIYFYEEKIFKKNIIASSFVVKSRLNARSIFQGCF